MDRIAKQTQRIALAIALSLLLHGLVLWLPQVHLPTLEKELPPLQAKLIPLPKTSAKLLHKQRKPVQPKPQPPLPAPAASGVIAASEPVAASAVAAASEPIAASAVAATNSPLPASAVAAASTPADTTLDDIPVEHPPLPMHARLRFNVYQGAQNFKVGESVHELDIEDGRYTLKASVQTTGVASMFKNYRMMQTSSGRSNRQILRPEKFTEQVDNSGEKSTSAADFDWASHTIRFANGRQAKLPAQAQDILSILYQFPALHELEDNIDINVGTGKKFETYHFRVVYEEAIQTPLGTLQTVHFRKQHGPHEEGLEIWFGQEYRLLPVKVRYLDRDGNVAAEAVITDIRVSDE